MSESDHTELKLGDRVSHKYFGEGVIAQTRGTGPDSEYFVRFARTAIWVLGEALVRVKDANHVAA